MVVIDERATGIPARCLACYAGFFGDFGKGAVAVVAIKQILPVVSDENIIPPIVIVVADADALTPARVQQPCFRGHVGKGAITIVVEEAIRGSLVRREPFNCRAVDEEKIRVTVSVVINPGRAGSRRFEQVPFGLRPAEHVDEVDSRLPRDVLESNVAGGCMHGCRGG